MHARFLFPETIVQANGHSDPIEIGELPGPFQLTLGITQIVEQESLDVTLEGSADGVTWAPKPVAAFPQKFYAGTTALVVAPEVRYLRVRWAVNRWGRGSLQPYFGFYVALTPLA